MLGLSHRTKVREEILDNIKPGSIIAFNVKYPNSSIMLSGKVQELIYNEVEMQYKVQTHNGSIFFVKRSLVVWLKTGSKWPLGVYNALKFGKIGSGANGA